MRPTPHPPHPRRRGRLRALEWLALAGLALACAARGQNAVPAVRSIGEYWSLNPEQKARPVPFSIDADVTYYDPFWKILFIQDSGGCAAYVPHSELAGFPFGWGQHLAVTGQFIPPGADVRFDHAVIRLVGQDSPVPLQTAGAILASNLFENKFVSVEGLVDHFSTSDPTHLGITLAAEGRSLVAWIISDKNASVADLTDTFVRVEGVYNGKFGPDGRLGTLEIMVQDMSHVKVLGKLGEDPRFRAPVNPIGSLSGLPGTQMVHVLGLVKSQDVGLSLTLRDSTGQVDVESAQLRPFAAGETVEAVGYPLNLGTRMKLTGAVYRSAGASARPASLPADTTLRLAAQVMELPPPEAAEGKPVRVTAVITWFNAGAPFFFVQDSTGGVRVMRTGVEPFRGYVGEKIQVSGRTAMGSFAPVIEASGCVKLSELAAPVPEPISLEHALTGAVEDNWVEMGGYLRRIRRQGVWNDLELVAALGEFTAVLPADEDASALVGGILRVHGVCTAEADSEHKLKGVTLWVPSREHLVVEEAPLKDPFSIPLRSLSALGRYNPEQSFNRLVRFSGVLLHQSLGHVLQIEDGGQTLRVNSEQRDPLVPGDRIEAVGLLVWQGNRYALRESAYRKTGHEAEPAAVRVPDGRAMAPEFDGRLVSLEGTVIDVSENRDQSWLTLQRGDSVFGAQVDLDRAVGGPSLEEGSYVTLKGVYEMIYDEFGRPSAYRINLRSMADVAVLRAPSWFTRGRIIAFAVALGVGILLFTGWVVVLRRQVSAQTRQIREQMQNEARLQSELQRTGKLESLGLLAGGIAHDFNNLLTAVIGNLSLIRLDPNLGRETAESVHDAEKAAARARDLTQQLLTFAKGGAPIQTAVLLAEVVREVAEFALRGAKVRCAFDIPEGLWPANVDKGQIGQVVQNIVINAMQAMPDGGVVEIKMRNEQVAGELGKVLAPGRYLHLSFRDHGTGIRPEDLERVFDPYFTTKKHGTGLGLATVHSIVKKHSGHISVESVPGDGTTFQIWLPAAPSRPASAPPFPDGAPSREGAGAARILFMDDEASIRQVGSAILRRRGYEVEAVCDGAEVVRRYAEAQGSGHPFSVVVLDLTIPGGMGGIQALEQLLRLNPAVRAIVSSGYSNDSVLSNYRAHGFRGMVTKPYESGDLLQEIERVLQDGAS